MKRSIDERTDLLLEEIAALTRSNAALEKAKQAAEAANLAKTRYLVGVSHEIRSPLNAIYGYAQLLERQDVVDPAEAGRVIRGASEHLTDIVEGLLDISRIESGVQKLSRDTVDLPKFLEAIVAMTRVQAEAKGLRLVYAPPRNLPTHVVTDEKRLRQILVNLLANAVKYTPAGTVTLTVAYRGLIADFSISDTGIGIAPDDLDDIFEPFNRGSAALAQSQPGAGLGLAITRMLAQVMGGDVSVSSAVGSGSDFRLRVMLPESRKVHAPEPAIGPVTGYLGVRRSILLVDDDPAQLRALSALLRPMGFTVHAASSGAQGIDLAARHAPDLMLLDIQLGDQTGWDVVKRLRTTGSNDALKILVVSANAHELGHGGVGSDAGHDGFVTKPVRFEALLDAIAAQLGLVWERGHAPDEPGNPSAGTSVHLPADRIDHLRRLAQVGDVRAIHAALDAMASTLPEVTPSIEALRGHVHDFDLNAFLRALD